MHKEYYIENLNYTSFLENQASSSFEKIKNIILDYSEKDSKILDIGCGAGNLMGMLSSKRNVEGVEISKTSVEKALSKGLRASTYDGKKLKFSPNYFDVVYSINVLEHTDDPINFLEEALRVTKVGGYFILQCPNFLSLTSNYHINTIGLSKKIKNLFTLILKLFSTNPKFNKMEVIKNDKFMPDDDACQETNPIDIIKWSKGKTHSLYFSSQYLYRKGIFWRFIDNSILKFIFGSSLFVFQKL